MPETRRRGQRSLPHWGRSAPRGPGRAGTSLPARLQPLLPAQFAVLRQRSDALGPTPACDSAPVSNLRSLRRLSSATSQSAHFSTSASTRPQPPPALAALIQAGPWCGLLCHRRQLAAKSPADCPCSVCQRKQCDHQTWWGPLRSQAPTRCSSLCVQEELYYMAMSPDADTMQPQEQAGSSAYIKMSSL